MEGLRCVCCLLLAASCLFSRRLLDFSSCFSLCDLLSASCALWVVLCCVLYFYVCCFEFTEWRCPRFPEGFCTRGAVAGSEGSELKVWTAVPWTGPVPCLRVFRPTSYTCFVSFFGCASVFLVLLRTFSISFLRPWTGWPLPCPRLAMLAAPKEVLHLEKLSIAALFRASFAPEFHSFFSRAWSDGPGRFPTSTNANASTSAHLDVCTLSRFAWVLLFSSCFDLMSSTSSCLD